MVYLAAFWPASSGSNKAEVDNAVNQLNSVLRQEDARFQVAVVGYEQVIQLHSRPAAPNPVPSWSAVCNLTAACFGCLAAHLLAQASACNRACAW